METVKRRQFNFKCREGTLILLKGIADKLDVPIWALSEYILTEYLARVAMKLGKDEAWWRSVAEQIHKNHIWVKEA